MMTSDIAAADTATTSNLVKRMFGLGLETWNTLTIAFLAGAVATAAGLLVSQYAVNKLQKAAAEKAAAEFEKYKTDQGVKVAALSQPC
jgi:hypothetical protein